MPDRYRNLDLNGPEQVRIQFEMETPSDDSRDRPDERDEGFWPSKDPDDCGYCSPDTYDEQHAIAVARMASWENDEWEYVGVVAVAHVAIPIGGGSYTTHTFRSAGLWGIESDAGEYLEEVFEEEKDALLDQLKTLGAALASGNYKTE
jgi:hypothetical protein